MTLSACKLQTVHLRRLLRVAGTVVTADLPELGAAWASSSAAALALPRLGLDVPTAGAAAELGARCCGPERGMSAAAGLPPSAEPGSCCCCCCRGSVRGAASAAVCGSADPAAWSTSSRPRAAGGAVAVLSGCVSPLGGSVSELPLDAASGMPPWAETSGPASRRPLLLLQKVRRLHSC